MSLLVTAVDASSLSAAGRRLGIPLATVRRKSAELAGYFCITFEPLDSAVSWSFPRPDARGEQVVALRSC